MSTYFSVFDCQACGHRVSVGFVGEMNECPIFCAACHDRCLLVPPQGEKILQTSLPHEIWILGRREVTIVSKKGRMTKNKLVQAWVSAGIQVPIEEGLRQIGSEVFLTYTACWETVPCPSCRQHGKLLGYREYLRHCPQCFSDKMSESDL